MTSSPPWTKEMDATLKRLWVDNHPDEIAQKMGVTVASVRGRSRRLKLGYISRPRKKNNSPGDSNHVPFTPRCGELLRNAGVKI